MKIAIVGSRSLSVDISQYVPESATSIISGGADGIDKCAEEYADKHNIPKLILKPQYYKYAGNAPLERNRAVVEASDEIIAIWDGRSSGTAFTIEYAKQMGKPVKVILTETCET